MTFVSPSTLRTRFSAAFFLLRPPSAPSSATWGAALLQSAPELRQILQQCGRFHEALRDFCSALLEETSALRPVGRRIAALFSRPFRLFSSNAPTNRPQCGGCLPNCCRKLRRIAAAGPPQCGGFKRNAFRQFSKIHRNASAQCGEKPPHCDLWQLVGPLAIGVPPLPTINVWMDSMLEIKK